MATITIGSARHDENGKYTNGKAGDGLQTDNNNDTSGEVSMQKFYVHNLGWNVVRAKDPKIATRLADNMRVICNNKNIGYSQTERLGIIKYGIMSKTKTNADCSSSVRACCIAAGFDPGNFTTANEVATLYATGKFEKAFKYVSQSKTPLFNGDILVSCKKGHTAIVVDGNARIVQATNTTESEKNYAKYYGESNNIDEVFKVIGVPDEYIGSVAKRKPVAEKNGFVGNYCGTYNQNIWLIGLAKGGNLMKP